LQLGVDRTGSSRGMDRQVAHLWMEWVDGVSSLGRRGVAAASTWTGTVGAGSCSWGGLVEGVTCRLSSRRGVKKRV